ncbi:MAG: hypothetical protein ACHP7O_11010 [Burkholderiales bacterium]
MEPLASRQTYAPVLALEIETMGSVAVSVANRWIRGWPARVKALLKAGTYLGLLDAQVGQEKDILANEPGLRHLARHEILQMYEIREAPP